MIHSSLAAPGSALTDRRMPFSRALTSLPTGKRGFLAGAPRGVAEKNRSGGISAPRSLGEAEARG
jgi:hypothetical protein